jgi:hypothetical protein
MRARLRLTLAFVFATAASSGCIVGIAEPPGDNGDGGTQADGAQTSDAPSTSDAPDASMTHDAPADGTGDGTTQGGDGGGIDAPAETGNDAPPDVTTQDAPALTQYIVFVTSTMYTGNLGGLAGADAKCMERAAAAMPSPLPGTFKAWMSDSTVSAAMHLTTHATVPYVMLDGTPIAADWNALTSANGAQVQNMITVDENGHTVPTSDSNCYDPTTGTNVAGHFVWTNSNDDGSLFTSAGTCQDLTSQSDADTGNTGSGSNDQMSTQWWSSWCNGQSCDSSAALYCVQQ